jgi:hypothetical protein
VKMAGGEQLVVTLSSVRRPHLEAGGVHRRRQAHILLVIMTRYENKLKVYSSSLQDDS